MSRSTSLFFPYSYHACRVSPVMPLLPSTSDLSNARKEKRASGQRWRQKYNAPRYRPNDIDVQLTYLFRCIWSIRNSSSKLWFSHSMVGSTERFHLSLTSKVHPRPRPREFEFETIAEARRGETGVCPGERCLFCLLVPLLRRQLGEKQNSQEMA